MNWQLSTAATAIKAPCFGDALFSGVSNDTRSLKQGDLYVAINGENFDGHDYLLQAKNSGAVAALVDRKIDVELPYIQVDDTIVGLGRLASCWRTQNNPFLIAITASNGKTTLKEMLATILQQQQSTLSTKGNLNNDVGVPLTLLRLNNEKYAVIEMGANHSNEIAYLSRMATPDVALLANAGRAHLEGFGSEQGVAQAKAEIIQGLKAGGTLVVNQDSQWIDDWKQLAAGKTVVSFGEAENADVRLLGDSIKTRMLAGELLSSFDVLLDGCKQNFKLKLLGKHNVINAVAVIAVCQVLGVSIKTMQQGLLKMLPVQGRLYSMPGLNNSLLIDDSYNANPDSVRAAIDVLAGMSGNRVLALGDLGELGSAAADLHKELGGYAKQAGIDQLLTCGDLSMYSSEAFSEGAQHFADKQSLIVYLQQTLAANDVLLLKGSRTAAMNEVVDALAGNQTS